MKHKTNNPAVIRFYELSALLSAHCHARGSARMTMVSLMTEYDKLKASNHKAWDEYCRLKNDKKQEQTHYY